MDTALKQERHSLASGHDQRDVLSLSLELKRYNILKILSGGYSLCMAAVSLGEDGWNITAKLNGKEELLELNYQTITARIWDALSEAEDEVMSYLIYRTDVQWP